MSGGGWWNRTLVLSGDREEQAWVHKTIKKVTEDIAGFHLNTALSALMEYINFLSGRESAQNKPSREAVRTLVLLLAPFAPHMTEELWQTVLGEKTDLIDAPWPGWDPKFLVSDTLEIVVQVNGKMRGTFEVAASAGDEAIKSEAQKLEKVQAHLAGQTIRKIIYVPKKLVNIVI